MQWQTTDYTNPHGDTLAQVRNKVLRNTYFLLALSMIPTIIGALVGLTMQIRMTGMMGIIAFFVVSFGAFYLIGKNRNNSMGVVFLLAYTGFMGLWLSQLLAVALTFSNGGQLIAMAAGGTAIIFFSLATLATVSKRDFSFLGKFLFVGLVVLIIASLANMFLQLPAMAIMISVVALFIFSAYILYDVQRIVNGGETNYVTATLAIYLDVYNVFISLLNILMIFTGRRD
jgi:modulator of FtsH protease